MMGERDYLKKLWMILIGVIAISSGLTFLIYKLGLMDKLLGKMQEHIILTMLIILPLLLSSITNMIYGFTITPLPYLLEGITYNRILGLTNVYNAKKITDSYYASEQQGVLGLLPTIIGFILTVYYIGGLIYLFIVDGFFIFSPKVIMWASILYGIFFINICIKSIVVGKISASFDDIVPFKRTSQYYIVPAIIGLIVILYYVSTPVMVKLGMSNKVLMKSTLVNTITIMVPFLLPIYSMITSRRVTNYVKGYFYKQSR